MCPKPDQDNHKGKSSTKLVSASIIQVIETETGWGM